MQKDRIGIVARRARAALKEALGRVTGDERLEAEGAGEKAAMHPSADDRAVGAGRRGRIHT